MSSNITKHQLRMLYALLRNNGLTESKSDLVLNYTNGRTSHATEMEANEFQSLVMMLQEYDPKTRMARKVYAIAYSLEWIYPGNDADRKMNTAKLDRFFLARGVVKKPLAKMTRAELARTVSQMEEIKRKGVIYDLKTILTDAGIENDISYNTKPH